MDLSPPRQSPSKMSTAFHPEEAAEGGSIARLRVLYKEEIAEFR